MTYDLEQVENYDVSPNERAGAVIRNFYEAGWLSEETDDVTYEKQVVMTEAGIALAEFLIQLSSPSKEEYSSYVFNIYNRLRNRDQWAGNPYTFALKPVYNDAKKLANSLKKLSTSIRSIIEKVVEEETLEELTNNLMSYCEGSFIKEYSRLIKEQNIHIYRPAILKELEAMRRDKELYELIVIDCFDNEGFDEELLAEQRVISLFEATIKFLSNDYNKIINDIQKKINIYLNLAGGRARFLLSHDDNTRGNVQQVLKLMINSLGSENEYIYGDLYDLYTQEFIDPASLRFPGKQKIIKKATVTEVPDMTQEDIDRAVAHQRKEVNPDGFHILENLRKQTGIDFQPHNMEISDLIEFKDYTKILEPNDINKAKSLKDSRYSGVINYMIDNNCKLEQEIIRWKNQNVLLNIQ